MAKEFVSKNLSGLKHMISHDKEDEIDENLVNNSRRSHGYGSHSESSAKSEYDETLHCHGPQNDQADNGMDKKARKKLVIASILCLIFMIGESVGGALAHSLAIMTDAAHLLTDFASFMISLFAIYIASRPATKSMSFGWHRAEVIGALISVLLIWVVTAILFYLAVMRIVNGKYEIDGKIMLITSIAGIVINIIMASSLHQHGHSHGGGGGSHSHDDKEAHGHEHAHSHAKTEKENINVRAAFIHVIGDLVQSIGVFIASLIIFIKPEYKIADPICTFIFSVLVLITTISILRDTMNVLMEGTPRELDFNEVKAAFYDLPGVVDIHNLRIWSLTMNKTAVSVHVAIDANEDHQRILRKVNKMLREKFEISDTTIQLENYVSQMAECQMCQDPLD